MTSPYVAFVQRADIYAITTCIDADRLYRDLAVADAATVGRCSCGADVYCAGYLSDGYHRGQP